MSDPNQKSLSELLSGFELGPAWAKANATRTSSHRDSKNQSHKPDTPTRNASSRERERRRADDSQRDPTYPRNKRGPHSHSRRHDAHTGPSPRESFVPPAEGIRVTLIPDPHAVRLVGKEVHQVARVYPLIDVAGILLAERGRCRARFEAAPNRDPMYRGKLDDSLFLTREEAVRHLWSAELRVRFMEEETIETEPPSGNFLSVARCGISGEWLGPPNFHTYQTTLRRLHQDQFPHLPFAAYQAKVKIERGDEAVQAWLETQKKQTRWRLIGADDESWISDSAVAARTLVSSCFDQAFDACHQAEMLASVPESKLSPALMTSLRMAGNHARKHPAVLIASICQALEAEHLPVFKRQGKLYTGPARPQPLPRDAVLAERPGIMVDWIRNHPPAKLEGLWQAVLPEGATAPPAEYAADLFWLLTQGHILLFTDDTLVVQEIRSHEAPGDNKDAPKPSKKKRPRAKGKAAAKPDSNAESTPDPTLESDPSIGPSAPVVSGPAISAPAVDGPSVTGPSVYTEFAREVSENM